MLEYSTAAPPNVFLLSYYVYIVHQSLSLPLLLSHYRDYPPHSTSQDDSALHVVRAPHAEQGEEMSRARGCGGEGK